MLMKPHLSWLKNHPIKAVAFTAAFTALAVSAGFRDDWLVPIACLYTVAVFIWAVTAWNDGSRKAV